MKDVIKSGLMKILSGHGKRGTIIDVHRNIVPIISGRHVDVNKFA